MNADIVAEMRRRTGLSVEGCQQVIGLVAGALTETRLERQSRKIALMGIAGRAFVCHVDGGLSVEDATAEAVKDALAIESAVAAAIDGTDVDDGRTSIAERPTCRGQEPTSSVPRGAGPPDAAQEE